MGRGNENQRSLCCSSPEAGDTPAHAMQTLLGAGDSIAETVLTLDYLEPESSTKPRSVRS